MERRHPASHAWLMIQVPGMMVAFLMLAWAPPAKGVMLLVPIGAGADRLLMPAALGAGARLVAPGPWRGSLIVAGDRTRLAGPMLRAGVAMLAATPPCAPLRGG